MNFLLDTNVVSELRREAKCHPEVRAWQEEHEVHHCFLSVISLLEIRLEVELALKRDPATGEILRAWYERKVKPAFAGRVLSVTPDVAANCALLHAKRPRPFRDSLIAATAHVFRLTVVIRNIADFADSDVLVVDPWNWR